MVTEVQTALYNTATLFEDLKAIPGKKDKQDFLTKQKDNQAFLDVLFFINNHFIKTGIQLKKLNKPVPSDESFNDVSELMEYIKENNTGRGEDIGRVQNFINSLNTELEKQFVKELVTSTLKIGVSAKTVNKVFGKNTVPVFDLQAAESFAKLSDKNRAAINEFFLTVKLDGNRCAIFKENGSITMYSRNGKLMEDFDELTPHFENVPDNYVFDGELLIHDYPEHYDASERFRATQAIVRKKGKKENVEFNIFDMLPISEFVNGASTRTFTERREQLSLIEETELLKVVPILYHGSDLTVISDIMKQVTSEGLEGLMLNKAEGLYQSKRTRDILKVKEFSSGDGVVTGMYQGKEGSRNENRLGGLVVTYKDTEVNVGGGYSDEQREQFWNDPQSIVGKVVEYNYFEESKNKDGKIDLRFATFVTIRDDKDVEDVNYE